MTCRSSLPARGKAASVRLLLICHGSAARSVLSFDGATKAKTPLAAPELIIEYSEEEVLPTEQLVGLHVP